MIYVSKSAAGGKFLRFLRLSMHIFLGESYPSLCTVQNLFSRRRCPIVVIIASVQPLSPGARNLRLTSAIDKVLGRTHKGGEPTGYGYPLMAAIAREAAETKRTCTRWLSLAG